jgi:hypothetical protein
MRLTVLVGYQCWLHGWFHFPVATAFDQWHVVGRIVTDLRPSMDSETPAERVSLTGVSAPLRSRRLNGIAARFSIIDGHVKMNRSAVLPGSVNPWLGV